MLRLGYSFDIFLDEIFVFDRNVIKRRQSLLTDKATATQRHDKLAGLSDNRRCIPTATDKEIPSITAVQKISANGIVIDRIFNAKEWRQCGDNVCMMADSFVHIWLQAGGKKHQRHMHLLMGERRIVPKPTLFIEFLPMVASQYDNCIVQCLAFFECFENPL